MGNTTSLKTVALFLVWLGNPLNEGLHANLGALLRCVALVKAALPTPAWVKSLFLFSESFRLLTGVSCSVSC